MSRDWRRALAFEVMTWLELAGEQDGKATAYSPGMPSEHCRRAGWLEAAMIVGKMRWYIPKREKPEAVVQNIMNALEARCNELGSAPEFVQKYGKYKYRRDYSGERSSAHCASAPVAIECAIGSVRSSVLPLVCTHKWEWKEYHETETDPGEPPFWECEKCGEGMGMSESEEGDPTVNFDNLSDQGARDYYDNWGKAPAGTPTQAFADWIGEDLDE